MRWFFNMKIGKKLIISFIVVSFFTVILGVAAIVGLGVTTSNGNLMYEKYMLTMSKLASASQLFEQSRTDVRQCLIEKGVPEKEVIANNFYKKLESISSYAEQAKASFTDPKYFDDKDEEHDKKFLSDINTFESLIGQYREQSGLSLDESLKSSELIAAVYLEKADSVADEMFTLMDSMLKYIEEQAKSVASGSQATAGSLNIVVVVIMLAAVVLSILLGIVIAHKISGPVNRIVKAAERIALGEMDVDVKVEYTDEIGRLAETFHKMLDGIHLQAGIIQVMADGDLSKDIDLRSERDIVNIKIKEMLENNNEIFAEISAVAKNVDTGAKQIDQASHTLAVGSIEQVAAIDRLLHSVAGIAEKTEANAEKAEKANKLGALARTDAEKSSEQMRRMTAAVGQINEASKSIGKVMKVIDDIAFQTNILALNAAVEAARAGQHGKGFAVVAQEVRNLATKSANAAAETAQMVTDSIAKANEGSRIAIETEESLVKIVDSINQSAIIVEDIATSSREQAKETALINENIRQIANVVQANSASSEESATSAEIMTRQTQILSDMLSRFKLNPNAKAGRYASRSFEDQVAEATQAFEDSAARKDSDEPDDFETSGDFNPHDPHDYSGEYENHVIDIPEKNQDDPIGHELIIDPSPFDGSDAEDFGKY